jgi:N6-L-threonylcarbamoyladenine synthase
MKILSIETSCDETAIAIIEASGGFKKPLFKVASSTLISQIDIHKEYGGVFPAIAKREHSKNLIPVLELALKKAKLFSLRKKPAPFDQKTFTKLEKLLEREPELMLAFLDFIPNINSPKIDAIAVTAGPGLAPALWVGVNFAKALSLVWNLPVIPTNHMEGHIAVSLLGKKPFSFPALALLISGGHTQLVLMKDWLKYKIIGETKDDAVGEAFDKVARMMGLPYPGGPEISKFAAIARKRKGSKNSFPAQRPEFIVSSQETILLALPRPMLHSPDLDFSFSGLKTAVLYMIKKIPDLTLEIKQQIAREFEDSVTEVLISKTKKALAAHNIKTLILGGGVVANSHIRKSFEKALKDFPDTKLYFPELSLSTDNAVMIAMASYFNYLKKPKQNKAFRADGNLSL